MASMEEKDQIAQEKFGKKFEELDPMERIQVGGTVGGRHNVAEEHHAQDPELRNKVAQEKFGKNFDELDPMQRIQIGGTIGGRTGHSESS